MIVVEGFPEDKISLALFASTLYNKFVGKLQK